MNDSSYDPPLDLVRLVNALFEGSLDDDSRTQLTEMLLADDSACHWYQQAMLVHSLLVLDGQHDTLDLPPSILAGGSSRSRRGGVSADIEDDPKLHCKQLLEFASQSLLELSIEEGPARRRHSRRYGGLAMAGIATAVAVGTCLFHFFSNESGSQPPLPRQQVAKVKNEVGARVVYETQERPHIPAGSAVQQGQYQLLDGLLELQYDSGATVLLMAPAEFRLIDEMRIELHDGRISANIPEAAVGFTIDTVGGSVVDLGTAFAVEARRGKDAEIHVFEGEVRVELDEIGNRINAPLQLLAGFATKIDLLSTIPSGIDLNRRKFVRSLAPELNRYAQAIMELSPAVYYRMEPTGNGEVLQDFSGNSAHAQIRRATTGDSPWTGGKVDAAFKLGGPSEQTYAVASDYPKAKHNQLSVVAWIYADSRPQWASIAKNWGASATTESRGQFHLGLLRSSGELAAHICDTTVPLDECGRHVDSSAIDSVPLPIHTWHHVAMVADGATLRLYRNGREVATTAYVTLYQNPSLRALAIGTKLNDSGDAPAAPKWSMWDGCLDELAVFNHALSAARIQHLYNLSQDDSPDR